MESEQPLHHGGWGAPRCQVVTLLTVTLDSHHKYPGPFHRKGTCSRDSVHRACFLDRVSICPGTHILRTARQGGLSESAKHPSEKQMSFRQRVHHSSGLKQERLSSALGLLVACLGKRRNCSQQAWVSEPMVLPYLSSGTGLHWGEGPTVQCVDAPGTGGHLENPRSLLRTPSLVSPEGN